MTKEEKVLFELLNKTITSIPERFCSEDCDWQLTDQLANEKWLDWSVTSGISKAVILIKNASFVIKLPFSHMFNEDDYSNAHYEWREECDDAIKEAEARNASQAEIDIICENYKAAEPMCDDDRFYYKLEGATYIDIEEMQKEPDWDYCNLECVIYNKAVERGLGAYFAEEHFLGTLDCNHPVYIQTRCTPIEELNYDYSSVEYSKKSAKTRARCKELDIYCFNPLWIADFIEYYGEDELKRLNTFLNEMNIGDLRGSNIGYLDGAPILFDYSGFRYWD